MAPSDKHNELTCLAQRWLANRVTRKGMRGTTEVTLAEGYVADVVVLCSLQSRFFRSYCSGSGMTPKIARPSLGPDGKRRYEVTGQIENYFACIFEAKATRSDFLSTFGPGDRHSNRHEPIGSLHWCVTPRKLVAQDELPDFWGLLEQRGAGLSEIKRPKINIVSQSQLDRIAHQLLWPLQAARRIRVCDDCGRWLRIVHCKRCTMRQAKDPKNQ